MNFWRKFWDGAPTSVLGLVNFLFVQWFFCRINRIYRVTYKDVAGYAGLKPVKELTGYKLMWGIVPLTGWWTDYILWPKRR